MSTILENLRVLRAAVADEPEHAFNLSLFESACGTLHCTLGLAATLPHFKAQGLFLDDDGNPLLSDGSGGEPKFSFEADYRPLFGSYAITDDLSDDTYQHLFASREAGVWDDDILTAWTGPRDAAGDVTDKELALARLDRALEYWNP